MGITGAWPGCGTLALLRLNIFRFYHSGLWSLGAFRGPKALQSIYLPPFYSLGSAVEGGGNHCYLIVCTSRSGKMQGVTTEDDSRQCHITTNTSFCIFEFIVFCGEKL
jgi:hypothetical protein